MHQCITLPVESVLFFIPSTSLCSLSSWFTSSYVYHLITVSTFALTICHYSAFHCRLTTHLFHKSFPPIFWFLPDFLHGSWTCTELTGHWHFFVLVSFARLSWSHSGLESTLNLVSYHIVVLLPVWMLWVKCRQLLIVQRWRHRMTERILHDVTTVRHIVISVTIFCCFVICWQISTDLSAALQVGDISYTVLQNGFLL